MTVKHVICKTYVNMFKKLYVNHDKHETHNMSSVIHRTRCYASSMKHGQVIIYRTVCCLRTKKLRRVDAHLSLGFLCKALFTDLAGEVV